MAKKDPCLTCDEETMACYDCPYNPDLADDGDLDPDGMEMDDDAADIDPDDESAYEYDGGYDPDDEEELTLD